MGSVQLSLVNTQEVALIDEADLEMVTGFRWRLMTLGYVQAQHRNLYIYLHRLIAGAGPNQMIDHINMDCLDNRSCNLRVATKSQNAANRNADQRKRGTTSRHKGVCWKAERNYWCAYIHVDGKTRYLGGFKDEDDAARAYNVAAAATWGRFARLNDVPDGGIPRHQRG